jgi:group I intron endonuclease
MRYTIYRTTNKINGKIYIGKHQTENPNDAYLGSGIALRNAIKKYGIENFEKIILFDFDTEKEMNDKERELITEEFVKRKETYNKGVGGEGGPHFKGKTHTDETRKKLSEISKNKPKVYTKESKERHAEAGRRRVWSEETRRKISEKAKGRKHSEETKKKLSEIEAKKRLSRGSEEVSRKAHNLEN